MNNLRATYDQRVIDSWTAQLASRKRGMGRVLVGLAIALATLLALVLITKVGLFALLFFGVFAALIIATLIDRGSLLCPNCSRPPLTAFERGPATSADFCPHCYYWLKTPYGAGRGGQA